MNILDIFYDEIINEASEGEIKSYFTFNVAFETDIAGVTRTYDNTRFEDIIVPTLRISDKEKFDELLVEYVMTARDFYPLKDAVIRMYFPLRQKHSQLFRPRAIHFSPSKKYSLCNWINSV